MQNDSGLILLTETYQSNVIISTMSQIYSICLKDQERNDSSVNEFEGEGLVVKINNGFKLRSWNIEKGAISSLFAYDECLVVGTFHGSLLLYDYDGELEKILETSQEQPEKSIKSEYENRVLQIKKNQNWIIALKKRHVKLIDMENPSKTKKKSLPSSIDKGMIYITNENEIVVVHRDALDRAFLLHRLSLPQL